jgi:hypothetical protein
MNYCCRTRDCGIGMDPLSVSVSAVSLVQATAALVGLLKDLKAGGEQRQRLCDEVTSLWAVLSHLEALDHNYDSRKGSSEGLSTLHQPGGVIQQCRAVVDGLRARLEPAKTKADRILQNLQWSFGKDEVQSKVDQLHRFQTIINGALAQASLSISGEILNHSVASRTLLEEQELQAIRKWLSPSNSFAQHTAISSRHCPGTGTIFVESLEFRQWSNTPKQTLWCKGAPGTGKTYFSSIAANHLRETSPEALILVAHCQYDDPVCQKLENIFGDLLRQSLPQHEIPNKLLQIYRAAQTSGTGISSEDALGLLSEQISRQGKSFIILDAVDEIFDLHVRQKLLEFSRPEATGANLLLTSRPLADIGSSLEPAGHICDGCQIISSRFQDVHFPELHRCFGGCDFDVCQSCYDSGLRCDDPRHAGLMRLVKHNYKIDIEASSHDVQRYVEWRVDSDTSVGSFLASRPHLRKELIDAALKQTMSL